MEVRPEALSLDQTQTIEDEALIARVVRDGDAGAYGLLVARNERAVRVFLLRLCRDPTRVDDLAQETFIKAFQKIGQQQDPARFGAWLGSIAYREFLQWRRSEVRYSDVVQRFANEPQAVATLADESPDLDTLLRVVNETEREALLLHLGFGLSHGELAATMELPLGTVKSHVNRGRQKIQAHFLAETAPAQTPAKEPQDPQTTQDACYGQ